MADLVLAGNTSGTVTVSVPAVAGTNTATIPAQTGTLEMLGSGASVLPSGVATVDFTGLPSWVKKITVLFSGVSLSGTDDILVQLGVSGSYSATYASTCAGIASTGTNISTSTTGFVIRSAANASITSGVMNICNVTGNVWIASFAGKQSTTAVQAGGGDVSLGGTVTSLRITGTTTNTFDAGTVNIIYEG